MKAELLKVIAGLECCACNEVVQICDATCPYYDSERCIDDLMRDALEILREVESDGLY